jgi:hypothetical protein
VERASDKNATRRVEETVGGEGEALGDGAKVDCETG